MAETENVKNRVKAEREFGDNAPPEWNENGLKGENGAQAEPARNRAGRDIINAKKIGKVIQVVGAKGWKDLDDDDDDDDDDDILEGPKFDEIASRLPTTSEIEFPPLEDDYSRWIQKLSRRSILVLSTFDLDVLYSAGRAVATSSNFSKHLPYLVRFRSLSPKHAPFRLSPLLQRPDRSNPAVIVIEASDSRASRFVDSVIGDAAAVEAAQEELQDDRLIILTNDRILGWEADPEGFRARNQHMPYDKVPFLIPRLQRTFPDNPDLCVALRDKILQQQRDRLWGAKEEEFYNLFSAYLGHGRICEEVEERYKARTLQALEKAKKIRAENLLSPKTPLENATLFLGAFFPNLTMNEFERILRILIGDRVQTIKKPVYVLDSDGTGHIEDIAEDRPLREIWAETYPDVLTRCHLAVSEGRDASSLVTLVDFDPPDLREDLRKAFLGIHRPIYDSLLRYVHEQQLLFDKNQIVMDSAVRLVIDSALADSQWLRKQGIGKVVLFDSPDFSTLRLYHLLRSFFQNPQLRDSVDQFLDELLVRKKYDLLMDLLWAFWNLPDFQVSFWLRRLFDEGTEEARGKVYARLLRSLRSGLGAQVISALTEWLPGAEAGNLSAANRAALRFFIDVHEESLFDSARHKKNWPPARTLLAVAAREDDPGHNSVAVRSLLHPAATPLLGERFEKQFDGWISLWLIPEPLRRFASDEVKGASLHESLGRHWLTAEDANAPPLEVLFFPSVVLVDWAVELMKEDPMPPAARTLLDRLLAEFSRNCDAYRRRALGALWTAVEECLLDVLTFLEQLDPESSDLDRVTFGNIRRDLRARRRCVRQLRLDLQARGRAARTH